MSNQFDPNDVRELYGHAEERRGLQISRIWETMKFTTTIIFGLFTATLTLLNYFPSSALMLLPIFAIVLTVFSLLNIRRQYRRFLEIITWINKIERYLGLYESIKEKGGNDKNKKHFEKENHLVPERFLKESKGYERGKDFIDAKLTICGHTMYSYFTWFYILCIVFAFILIGVILHTVYCSPA